MNKLITINEVIKEKVQNVREGDLVIKLFDVAEELGIGKEIEFENVFSLAVLKYLEGVYRDTATLHIDHLYKSVKNVYYIVELYIRGYYNKEQYITYEEFLRQIKLGNAKQIIISAEEVFHKHIHRLKNIISKSKKRIPKNRSYIDTRALLKELDTDLSICELYPKLPKNLPENLSEFCFGRIHGLCGAMAVQKLMGFLNLEKMVYSLYNELTIISKIDPKYIDKIVKTFYKMIGMKIPFNLFEKVINNYIFAMPYSECPEQLDISKVEAELLIKEIRLGTLDANKLVEQFIDKYGFTGYNEEYLKAYGAYTQKRVDTLRDSNYFGELFIITPPEWS